MSYGFSYNSLIQKFRLMHCGIVCKSILFVWEKWRKKEHKLLLTEPNAKRLQCEHQSVYCNVVAAAVGHKFCLGRHFCFCSIAWPLLLLPFYRNHKQLLRFTRSLQWFRLNRCWKCVCFVFIIESLFICCVNDGICTGLMCSFKVLATVPELCSHMNIEIKCQSSFSVWNTRRQSLFVSLLVAISLYLELAEDFRRRRRRRSKLLKLNLVAEIFKRNKIAFDVNNKYTAPSCPSG